MSVEITDAFVQEYKANVQLLLQQRGSILRPFVSSDTYNGKAAKIVDQFGQVTAIPRVGRHGDTPMADTPQTARWLTPVDYEVPADLIDTVDKLRLIIDPMSAYAQAQAYAIGRAQDDSIIASHFGAALTGENGTTSTSFDSGNQIAVSVGGANSGLNVAKLIAARTKLMANQVDLRNEPVHIAITSKQHANLLAEIQIISKEYNETPVLVNGMVERFLGFNFHVCERLVTSSASTRRCPVWVPSGLHLGEWAPLEVKISERPDKRYSWQVYTTATFNSTRVEEGKCVEILCYEP